MPPCRGISAAAAPTCESARASSARRTVRRAARRAARRRRDMSVDLSRRQFLSVSAALGGGLLIGFTTSPSIRNAEGAAGATFAPNAFIRIGSDGKVVLIMPYVEMGQGTYTSIPMLIAEELEVDLKQVRLEHAPPNEKLYANPLLGVQATGNSNAVRGAWQPLRQAGATARTMLVAAAAKRWSVEPASCRAQSGEVLHAPTGRKIKYGDLAADASRMPVPEKATLNSGAVAQNIGDAQKAMATAVTKVEATYQVPFLAHATMEPMNCTVHVRKDGCEIWVGNQALARAQATAAKTTGLPLDKVVVHNHLIGGGFGRRLEVDGVTRAVQIAKQAEGPVKVVWAREEDIQHDMYRPVFFDRLSAGLDNKGMPVAWNHRFAGSSIIARWLPPGFNNGLDPDTTEGAIDLVYALPNLHVEYLRAQPAGVPTAFLRSLGP